MTDKALSRNHGLSPAHAMLAAAPFPLALGALLSDWAYSGTYQVQWINFADWLVAGSLLFAGMAIAASLVRMTIRRRWGERSSLIAFGVLVAFFVVQFLNALTHSKDAYASMPAGLILSVFATILALAAAWLTLANIYRGDVR